MTNLFFIAIGAAATIAGGPVAAREPATTNAAPATQTSTSRAARPEQRYCVESSITGSMLRRKTCLTRGDWLQQGVDPLRPNK